MGSSHIATYVVSDFQMRKIQTYLLLFKWQLMVLEDRYDIDESENDKLYDRSL